MKKKKIDKLINKWTYRLGLRWWKVTVTYVEDVQEVATTFMEQDTTVLAKAFCDWRYATCNLYFNYYHLKDMSKEDIEFTIVHELCHALVNEMREQGIDHEERVVTGLTKAFLWTEADCK